MKRLIVLFGAVVGLSLFFSGCLNVDTPDNGNSLQQQLINDTTFIGKYLRTNNIPALKDASGLFFIIDSQGTGFPPKLNSTVNFTYKGKLMDGTVFDQGTLNGKPTDYILGFQIGLPLMPKGSTGRLFIPSGYAYGTNGTSSIPANSNLIFEITLNDVVVTDAEKTQLASDTVAIDDYLSTNSINAIKDKTGIRYVVTQTGAGATPTLYSKVKMNYTGKMISNGTIFYSGSSAPDANFDSRVINYIHGFQAVLTKIPVGSKVTVYIPSGLAFGAIPVNSGTATIPANSNVVYDIELVEIVP